MNINSVSSQTTATPPTVSTNSGAITIKTSALNGETGDDKQADKLLQLISGQATEQASLFASAGLTGTSVNLYV